MTKTQVIQLVQQMPDEFRLEDLVMHLAKQRDIEEAERLARWKQTLSAEELQQWEAEAAKLRAQLEEAQKEPTFTYAEARAYLAAHRTVTAASGAGQ